MATKLIDNTLTGSISSDYQPPNTVFSVQVSGISEDSKAKVDVRVRLDNSLDYIPKHTFRKNGRAAMVFVSFPLVEFEVSGNEPGNRITVWVG